MRRGFLTWRDPRGLDQGGACLVFPLPNRPRKAAQLPGWVLRPRKSAQQPHWVLRPQRPPPGRVGPKVVGRREERGKKRRVRWWEGALQDHTIREGTAGISTI